MIDNLRILNAKYITALVKEALAEDIGSGDITAALIPADSTATANVITREPMIVCGNMFVQAVFKQVNSACNIIFHLQDGDHATADQILFTVTGQTRALLTAERTALNFLQMLSGTATLTQKYVAALKGTKTTLLDTRKTLPLYRLAQKYAVQCGGGQNHRMGLYDAFLIKENHILACGSIGKAVATAHQIAPGKSVEVEVENLSELYEAIKAGADIVMLDNFDLPGMHEAVKMNQGKAKLEVSGNINLNNIHQIAQTGVDFISVGSLTKHLRAIDLSMRLVECKA